MFLVLFALLFNPFVIGFFWWTTSGYLSFGEAQSAIIALARLAGLLAVYCVLLQLILIGRVAWVERIFGLDKLSRVHHWNGYVALSLIITHPVLLLIGYSANAKVSLVTQFFDFWRNYEYVWLAVIGLALFIIVVGLSIRIARKHLNYESWYAVHLFNYLAIVLVFWHQLANGADFINQTFVWYWYALYAFAISNLILFRFIRPLYYFTHHRFEIHHIEHETHDTISVYITGVKLHTFSIKAGQFMIVRFLQKGFWWQAHPFSLSIGPQKNLLRLTIKNVGDFTSQITKLKKGTTTLIDGPHGIFGSTHSLPKKLLFIAGGVGITPIRSLLETLPNNDVVLLYGNRTSQDIIFKKELNDLAKKYSFTLHYIMSSQSNWKGEKGKIDQEKISRLVPDAAKRDTYLCGPPPMMESVKQSLLALGTPRAHIHYEKFSLS